LPAWSRETLGNRLNEISTSSFSLFPARAPNTCGNIFSFFVSLVRLRSGTWNRAAVSIKAYRATFENPENPTTTPHAARVLAWRRGHVGWVPAASSPSKIVGRYVTAWNPLRLAALIAGKTARSNRRQWETPCLDCSFKKCPSEMHREKQIGRLWLRTNGSFFSSKTQTKSSEKSVGLAKRHELLSGFLFLSAPHPDPVLSFSQDVLCGSALAAAGNSDHRRASFVGGRSLTFLRRHRHWGIVLRDKSIARHQSKPPLQI